MQYYIDAHCHLDLFDQIDKNPSRENQNPIKTISVTNAPAFFGHNLELFKELSNIRIALGMHPELITSFHEQMPVFRDSIHLTKYIGEIGLDGSKDLEHSYTLQKDIFVDILNTVKTAGPKILTIHSRNAANETIETLHNCLRKSDSLVILHWFSGTITELNKGINYGFYCSVNHKMATSAKGIQLIEKIPLDKIITETDAPFTLDNKVKSRLDSLELTIQRISAIKKIDKQIIQNRIFENFRTLLKALE